MVGELGQGLGGSNACAAWNAGPLEYPRAHGLGPLGGIAPNPVKPDERLVDAIYLLRWIQSRRKAHHLIRHVAIECKVADSAISPASSSRCRLSCQGCPILIPKALASLLRAMPQPSLLESETTGTIQTGAKHAPAADKSSTRQSRQACDYLEAIVGIAKDITLPLPVSS